MTHQDIMKECRKLAKEQSLTFRRSKTVSKINGAACYEIESGIQHKVLHQGSSTTIWGTLLSECFKNL